MTQPLRSHMLQRCQLLREDPDLLEFVAAGERQRATEQCIVGAITLAPGPLSPEENLGQADPGGLGLLMLDGLVLRRVQTTGRCGAELLGQGDLIRPWRSWAPEGSLEPSVEWRVLERTRVALLDVRATARLAPYPAVLGAITGRALDRSRALALVMAIIHQPRIEVRLHMLLWHLADRWGRVRGDGVVLPLRLSHSLLSDLVCARRPSVTVGLHGLTEAGLIRRVEDGWLLFGDPGSVAFGAEAVAAGAAGVDELTEPDE